MIRKSKNTIGLAVLLVLAFVFVLFLHGAVPYVATPTLGQAVWSSGFSQSFINDSVFSVYARNFGAPAPAAIAFGLAGAYPMALLIGLGLHPADAYAAMSAFWLGIAYFSAYKTGQLFGAARVPAIFGAVLWMSMPIIWRHAGYSMTGLGIALLAFYFLVALKLFLPCGNVTANRLRRGVLYAVACLIAVFMDGYSFMMFAVGASILAGWVFLRYRGHRRELIRYAFPVHILAFSLAYIAYICYIGKSGFEGGSPDFFRGWGVDLAFIAVPTKGIHWIPDLLGWSASRSGKEQFGDSSVWVTTFSLPLFATAGWAWWKLKEYRKISSGLLLILLIGFYMALGPSLKINSTKPVNQNTSRGMAEEYAIAPTGSAWIYENLPGFKSMRASYRWLALAVFAAWLLTILAFSSSSRRTRAIAVSLSSVVLALNLPPLNIKWNQSVAHRSQFLQIDDDLLPDMRQDLLEGDTVAFLPYRNDFLINYLAAQLKIVTYNVGGDKNLNEARSHWPAIMRQFQMGSIDADFSGQVLFLLAKGDADAVVLPYIDMLWAAHSWPAQTQYKNTFNLVLTQLSASGFVTITQRQYYSVIRISPAYQDIVGSKSLEHLVLDAYCIQPFCLKSLSRSMPSQVGVLDGKYLRSDQKKGFLQFGPYAALNPGTYHLSVHGLMQENPGAWVDVVAKKGTVQYAKFPLQAIGNSDGVLSQGLVELDEPVADIEVRVYVTEQDRVQLEGYSLVPVDGSGPRSTQ